MRKYAVLAAGAVLLAGLMINANHPGFMADSAFAQEKAAKVLSKGAIAIGATKTARLNAREMHQYMLTLKAPADISFEMDAKGTPAINPVIEIQDSGKKTIESTPNTSNEAFAKTIRTLEPGRYYILASSAGNKVGQYTLKVKRFEPGGP